MTHFCTYFDINYLAAGLALRGSLERHADDFILWVLCLDDATYQALAEWEIPGTVLVRLADLEGFDPDLTAAKSSRSRVEYYFTCSASWMLYVMQQVGDDAVVVYADADLFFYASPDPVLEELNGASVLIFRHHFPERLRHLERFGIYNVGLIAMRRDARAISCLEWWRARCLEWCYDRCEDGRFADQKYLDEWPRLFEGVRESCHPGGGLGPWNVGTWCELKRTSVPCDPVFFHFHGFRRLRCWLFDTGLGSYGERASGGLRRQIFRPYVRAHRDAQRWIDARLSSQVADTLPQRLTHLGLRYAVGSILRGHTLVGIGRWVI